MGCFLSCFRGRPGSASGDGLQDPLVRESRLGDAFLDDRDEDTAKLEAGGNLKEDLGNGGGLHDELRREANYLKSCGAISETPPEILKVSNQIKADDSNECDATPNNAQDIRGIMVSEDKEYISEEFNCDAHGALSHDQNTDEGADDVSGVEYKDNSSEGFNRDGHGALSHDQNTDEGADDVSGLESESASLLQDKSSCQNITNQNLDSSDSPFPTPLVLRGDIQTPGTMFTAYQQNVKTGKSGRTGKQFIYPVLRPIENKLEWMELRDESSPMIASHPPKRRYLCEDSTEKPQQALPSSVSTDTELPESAPFSFHAKRTGQAEVVTSPEEHKDQNGSQQLLDGGVGELPKISSYNEKHGVASLSSWLKTSSADGSESQSGISGDFGNLPGFGRIGDITDVPIFVASGLNWNDDNPTPMLPKAVWDGNGIPNTTTKYKEDQKVNWHATPFEERLMKVLSDEKPKHERKMSGKLIHLEEDAMESLATASS